MEVAASAEEDLVEADSEAVDSAGEDLAAVLLEVVSVGVDLVAVTLEGADLVDSAAVASEGPVWGVVLSEVEASAASATRAERAFPMGREAT